MEEKWEFQTGRKMRKIKTGAIEHGKVIEKVGGKLVQLNIEN